MSVTEGIEITVKPEHVRCATGKGHLFERCTCDDSKCRRWVCIVCEHIIDRSRKASA